jgi:hypothetical protein
MVAKLPKSGRNPKKERASQVFAVSCDSRSFCRKGSVRWSVGYSECRSLDGKPSGLQAQPRRRESSSNEVRLAKGQVRIVLLSKDVHYRPPFLNRRKILSHFLFADSHRQKTYAGCILSGRACPVEDRTPVCPCVLLEIWPEETRL